VSAPRSFPSESAAFKMCMLAVDCLLSPVVFVATRPGQVASMYVRTSSLASSHTHGAHSPSPRVQVRPSVSCVVRTAVLWHIGISMSWHGLKRTTYAPITPSQTRARRSRTLRTGA
jgi:hypothetical protein